MKGQNKRQLLVVLLFLVCSILLWGVAFTKWIQGDISGMVSNIVAGVIIPPISIAVSRRTIIKKQSAQIRVHKSCASIGQSYFETQTVYTLQEYRAFRHTVDNKIYKRGLILNSLIILLSILAFFCWLGSGRVQAIVCIVLVAVLALIPDCIRAVQEKLTFQSNCLLQNRLYCFRFYPNYIEQISKMERIQYDYDEIKYILETPSHFYLMPSRSWGMIIIKDTCPAELLFFLQQLKDM